MLNRNLFDCFSESNTKKKIAINSDDDSVDIPSISNVNKIIRDDSNNYSELCIYAKQSLRICTNLKYDIKRLHDGQDYLKMMLDKIFNQLNNQTNSNSDSHSLNHYDIPHNITNENDLNEWEDTIEDSSYLSKAAQQLSLMGSHSISETVRKLMQRLFSDTFLVGYSFIGFKGKKTFSNLRSYDLIKYKLYLICII
ncbi:uncharacterized protein LOC132943161 [Metopolophium dirhodum]|uniref:uncharacterized protein LOC132943161 n=1 Tax=Metopolophium dirhodum TaxID=44670 RepID=UPI00298FACCF|nr:uncharacterized protein LOC132943161 [Metopolophium dirhodum]